MILHITKDQYINDTYCKEKGTNLKYNEETTYWTGEEWDLGNPTCEVCILVYFYENNPHK